MQHKPKQPFTQHGQMITGPSITESDWGRFHWEKRAAEFAGPIAAISRNNPLIHQIIQRYAHGEIITKEEALSQMVVLLAKDWTEIQKRAYEMAALMTVPTVVPSENPFDQE
jgi:hypothetical protein